MQKILIILISLLMSACSTVKNMNVSEDVKPWEKDILAQQGMQFPRIKCSHLLTTTSFSVEKHLQAAMVLAAAVVAATNTTRIFHSNATLFYLIICLL